MKNECTVLGSVAHIIMARGLVVLVDACEVAHLSAHRWWPQRCGALGQWYALATPPVVHGKRSGHIRMHRVLVGATLGVCVDHINGDTLDNRRSNLRLASRRENNANRRGPQMNNTSGYLGVSLTASRRWRATVQFGGKQIHIGSYDSPEEAARARDAEALRLFGEFASLNFIERTGTNG